MLLIVHGRIKNYAPFHLRSVVRTTSRHFQPSNFKPELYLRALAQTFIPNQGVSLQYTIKSNIIINNYFSFISQILDLAMYAAYAWIIVRFASHAAETAFCTKN